MFTTIELREFLLLLFTIVYSLYEEIYKFFQNYLKDRHRIVYDKKTNEQYLERYYLFLKERKYFPFNIFIHKFLKSDPDDLHDHPWPYFTFILYGGYYEHTPEGKFWRAPGHFRFSSAKSLHRIELKKDENGDVINAWTLFIPGPQIREWGFVKNGNWINNETYNKEE